MKNIKSYKEYIQENMDSIPELTNKEIIYSDPADLGDGRKEVDPKDIKDPEFNILVARGRPEVVEEMKNDVESEDIDGIEHRAKTEIDRFKTFAAKQ